MTFINVPNQTLRALEFKIASSVFKIYNIIYHITTLVSNVIQPLRIFLVSKTCEIRFHDVIGQSTVPMYSYAKILNMADMHGQMSMFWTLIFQFNSIDSVMR